MKKDTLRNRKRYARKATRGGGEPLLGRRSVGGVVEIVINDLLTKFCKFVVHGTDCPN